MSAINKMLRDLDRRNVSPNEKIVLDKSLSAAGSAPARRQNTLVIVAASSLLLLGAYFAYRWTVSPNSGSQRLPSELTNAMLGQSAAPPALPASATALPVSTTADPGVSPVVQPVVSPQALAAPAVAALSVIPPSPAATEVSTAPILIAAATPARMTDVPPSRLPEQMDDRVAILARPGTTAPAMGAPAAMAATAAATAPLAPATIAALPMSSRIATVPTPDSALALVRPAPATAIRPMAERDPATPRVALNESPDAIQKRFSAPPRRGADAELARAIGILQQGRVEEAMEGLRKVIALDPAHEIARQTLVALSVEQGRIDVAQALLNDGLTINPNQTAFALLLARLTLESGTAGAAASVLQKYAGSGRDNAQYRGLHAAVLQRAGRHAEAITEFNAALTLSPGIGAWWVGLGTSQQALGENRDAASSYESARNATSLTAELAALVDQRLRQIK